MRKNILSKELAEELDKALIKKFKKIKVHSSFIDNIWGVDLAGMQLIRKLNKWIRFLLCVTDIFNKKTWVIPLRDKKCITITNGFQKIPKEYNCKPSKIWVEKDREFYNRSMKPWLEKKL